jgi:hypothetical protein
MATPEITPLRVFQNQRPGLALEVGMEINVMIPGELVRVRIMKVVSENRLVAEIISNVIGKTGHGYAKTDILTAERGIDSIGQACWRSISEREMEMRELRQRLADEQTEREAEEAAAKVAAIRARDLAVQGITEEVSSTWNDEWEKMNGRG